MNGNSGEEHNVTREPGRTVVIGGWTATILFSGLMLVMGIVNIIGPEKVVDQIHALGYPDYIRYFLGASKVLGALTLLLSRSARLREWAYAGFTLELLLASYSHAMVQDGVGKALFPIVLEAVLMTSYFLKHCPPGTCRSRPDSQPATLANPAQA
jgi:hypothetical protein